MARNTVKKTNTAAIEAVTRRMVIKSEKGAIGPRWELVITRPKGGGPGKIPFAEMLKGIRDESALLRSQLQQLTSMEQELKTLKKSAK